MSHPLAASKKKNKPSKTPTKGPPMKPYCLI